MRRGVGPHRLLNGMPGHVAEHLNFVANPDGSATGSGAGLQILNAFLSMQAQLFVPLGICVTPDHRADLCYLARRAEPIKPRGQ
jgi:hypothetical protein